VSGGARAGRWLLLALATLAASLAAEALGVPSPELFAALLCGLAYGILGDVALDVPRPVVTAAQAVVGVAFGAYLQSAALSALAGQWAPVAAVTLGTLALSLAVGLLVGSRTGIGAPTALLGLVAGGASGIVAMSRELGADDPLVAFMQYLRVLVVVALTPILAAVFAPDAGVGGSVDLGGHAGLAVDLAYTAGCSVAGIALARVLPVPAGTLLLPLILAGALTLSGLSGDGSVPAVVQALAFAVIGVQVGLRFTPARVREARRILPAVLVAIALLIVGCGAFAVVLAPWADVTFLDAYLATTPGGMYAVLATAVGADADTTFVLAVQAVRLLAMVLAAPPLVRLLAPRF